LSRKKKKKKKKKKKNQPKIQQFIRNISRKQTYRQSGWVQRSQKCETSFLRR